MDALYCFLELKKDNQKKKTKASQVHSAAYISYLRFSVSCCNFMSQIPPSLSVQLKFKKWHPCWLH